MHVCVPCDDHNSSCCFGCFVVSLTSFIRLNFHAFKTRLHTHTHTQTQTYPLAHKLTHTHTHLFFCIHTDTDTDTDTDTQTHTQTHTHTFVLLSSHTNTHTQTAHTHTHTPAHGSEAASGTRSDTMDVLNTRRHMQASRESMEYAEPPNLSRPPRH